jgi:hypothetical protein
MNCLSLHNVAAAAAGLENLEKSTTKGKTIKIVSTTCEYHPSGQRTHLKSFVRKSTSNASSLYHRNQCLVMHEIINFAAFRIPNGLGAQEWASNHGLQIIVKLVLQRNSC